MMDMKEEMMSDAVDDVMEDGEEDEEEEGDKILREVLDEIGVHLSQQVSLLSSLLSHVLFTFFHLQLTDAPTGLSSISSPLTERKPVALGETNGGSGSPKGDDAAGAGPSDEDSLQARLDALRRG